MNKIKLIEESPKIKKVFEENQKKNRKLLSSESFKQKVI